MHMIQYTVPEDWAALGWGTIHSLQFRADGEELAAVLEGGGESRIAFWDLQRNLEGKAINAGGSDFEGGVGPVLSPNFDRIARIGYHLAEGGGLHAILSRRSRGKLVDRYLAWWWEEAVSALCFSPDGRHLAVIGWNSHDSDPGEGVALWHVAAVQRVRASGAGEPTWVERSKAARLLAADDFLLSLAFSPDGTTLAAGTANQGVLRWDVATGQPVPGIPLHEPVRAWVDGLAFSPDGKTLAARVSTSRRPLFLFDTTSGTSLPVPPKGQRSSSYADSSFHDFAFHPAGRLLATVALGNTVTLWDTATGKKQRILTGDSETRCFRCLAFSPDGRSCAAGSDNGQVVVWDVEG